MCCGDILPFYTSGISSYCCACPPGSFRLLMERPSSYWCYTGSNQSFRERAKEKLNAFPGLFLCCYKGGWERRNHNLVRQCELTLFAELLDHSPTETSLASTLSPSELLFCFLSAGVRRQGLGRKGRRGVKEMRQISALIKSPSTILWS